MEPDGTLWNFGYVSSAKKRVFWHISGTGKLKKVGQIHCDPISAPHDFVVTSKHLEMLIPPTPRSRSERLRTSQKYGHLFKGM